MKKQVTILMALLGIIIQTFAGDDSKSRIIIYREHNPSGSAISYKVNANDSLIGKIRNSSWFEWECEPGEYIFDINGIKSTQVQFTVRENETYYLRMGIKVSMWSSVPELLLVDNISALPALNNPNLKNIQPGAAPLSRPKNRIGLKVAAGAGFESTPIFMTNDDRESKISFGGGTMIGLNYGVELGKQFDLSFDLGYQSTGLRPALSNGSWNFNRGLLAATPALIIPVDDGYFMRFRIGAGFSYNWGTTMNIKGSKIPGGFNDTWDYTNALGYHLVTEFEMNFNDYWSILYGIKLYGARYEFEPGSRNYPVVNTLKNPKGSGIDFIFGLSCHF